MPVFGFTFEVRASLSAVSEFHRDTRALKRLTPPPVCVQMHSVEPLGEGTVSEFTMWFGPLPVRWVAVHSNVSQNGFTDTQKRGLMKSWQHKHRFTAEGDDTTRIDEHIEYEHHADWRGILSRVLFARSALRLLFTYRRLVTRRAVEGNWTGSPGRNRW
jgi:ligand-binding SRPBCC domain-containing protein